MKRLVKFSFHQPNEETKKSYSPPMIPASSRGLAWSPPLAPDTSTCVVAVASGKGYLPCMSLTKYLRKGMRNKMPNTPPSAEARNMLKNEVVISGYFDWRM